MIETVKSRSRIFKQGSRGLAKSRIYHSMHLARGLLHTLIRNTCTCGLEHPRCRITNSDGTFILEQTLVIESRKCGSDYILQIEVVLIVSLGRSKVLESNFLSCLLEVTLYVSSH